jgi:GNAT superfamily N-acetyltransferase
VSRASQDGSSRDTPEAAEALTFRAITSADVPQLAAEVADAFSRYRDFAPADWQPPSADSEAERLGRSLNEGGFWGEAAFQETMLAGHAALIPAARHWFRTEPDAKVAHLIHLFVIPEYWGSGLGTQLMAHANSAAAAREHTSMRLFVFAGQSRARRFYEREGFISIGEPFEFAGLPALEYRRQLS